jgi:hypothetical protein
MLVKANRYDQKNEAQPNAEQELSKLYPGDNASKLT